MAHHKWSESSDEGISSCSLSNGEPLGKVSERGSHIILHQALNLLAAFNLLAVCGRDQRGAPEGGEARWKYFLENNAK